jgi:hypothetical protein
MRRQTSGYIHEPTRGAQPETRARPATSLLMAFLIETTANIKQSHPYASSAHADA